MGTVTTCWDATVHKEPDFERYHRLVELVMVMLGGNEHPPIEYYIASFEDFEDRLYKYMPELSEGQDRNALLVVAHCRSVLRGEQPVVLIESYNALDDKVFIHEFLHAVLRARAPHPNILDNHVVIEEVVRRILTSALYKEVTRVNN
jgi:hypothetical protein